MLLLWLVFFVIIGILNLLETPEQMKRDKSFIDTQVKPSIEFIENFRKQNFRLPTKTEYYKWKIVYDKDYLINLKISKDSLVAENGEYIRSCRELPTEYTNECKNIDWSKNYMIAVWRGEWHEYYLSWRNAYDTNNYNWVDGFIGMIVCFCIGFMPLIIWQLSTRKKKGTTNSREPNNKSQL